MSNSKLLNMLSIFQQFYHYKVYMPQEFAHSRHPTTLISFPRGFTDKLNDQKYLVVDSENEEQANSSRLKKTKQITPASSLINYSSSTIAKSRDQDFAIFASSHRELQNKYIDVEIKQAEKEVCKLEKECKLLQNMINDMAIQQAKIVVQLRSRERKLASQKEIKIVATNRINCLIHPSIEKKLEKGNKANQSLLIEQNKPETSLVTPAFTVCFEGGSYVKSGDEAKTINIAREPLKIKENNIKPQEQENITKQQENKPANKRKVITIHHTIKSRQKQRLTKSKKA